ncbi:MAG: hypothetical protein QMD50_03080 [Patescibacteria group bacterium]|nr:hypothetical protein [Patescibacteria group bacterium]
MNPKIIFKFLFFGLLIFFGSIVFNIANAQTPPAVPQGFTAERFSGCAIKFSWNQPDNGVPVLSYKMSRKKSSDPLTAFSSYKVIDLDYSVVSGTGTKAYIEKHGGPSGSMSNRQIYPDTAYDFALQACGGSSLTNCSVTSTPIKTVPAIPSGYTPSGWGLTPSSSTIVSIEAQDDGNVRLKWHLNSNAQVSQYFKDYQYPSVYGVGILKDFGLFYLKAFSSLDEWGGSFTSPPSIKKSLTVKDVELVEGTSLLFPESLKPGGVPDHAYGFVVQTIDMAGEYCSENISGHHKDSLGSSPFPNSPGLIIPNPPYFKNEMLSGTYDSDGNVIARVEWVDASKGLGAEDYFEIGKAFNLSGPYNFLKSVSGIDQGALDTTTASTTDVCDVSKNPSCFYRVRACRDRGGIKACSFWSASAHTKEVLETPKNFQVRLIYVSTSIKKSLISLAWTDISGVEDGYQIQHSAGSDGKILTPPWEDIYVVADTTSYFSDSIPLGETRYFWVAAYQKDDYGNIISRSKPTEILSIDTNITKVLKGQVWSGYEPLTGLASDEIASGIGWISLNSNELNFDSEGKPLGYSVHIANSGLVSGFAQTSAFKAGGYWHGYGRISFNPVDLIGCPKAPCEARFDSTTNMFSGWAKLINISSAKNASGFPGWIKLSGTLGEIIQNTTVPTPPPPTAYSFDLKNFVNRFVSLVAPQEIQKLVSNIVIQVGAQYPPPPPPPPTPLPADAYGLVYNPTTKTVNGTVWGGDQVGWIAFSNTNPKCNTRGSQTGSCNVEVDLITPAPQPGAVANVSVTAGPGGWLWCDANPFYRVAWDYNPGTSGALQRGYEIELRNSLDNTLIYSTSTLFDSASSILLDKPLEKLTPLGESLPRTFYASVRVMNTNSIWSQFANSPNITTPDHYPPLVDFTETRLASSDYSFTDTSINRSLPLSSFYPTSLWSRNWTFENANPSTATTESVSLVQFLSLTDADAEVVLTIDDTGAITCGFAKNVPINASTRTDTLIRRIYRER